MKYSFIFIILLAWSISGCSFLGFHSDPYGLEDNEEVEEGMAEEGTYEDEEEEDMEEAEEEEEGSEKRGFFARLMSFGDDDEEDMDMEEEEGYEDDGEELGEERSTEESGDDEQMYADMESYDEDDEGMGEDMESYEEKDGEEGTTQATTADTGDYYEKSPLPITSTTRKLISVKKIKTSPYRRSGFLVNAVYLARPGDTIESISQKIYGQDRSGDLYSINPHFRSRPLKTGDKVYYPSPQRPDDSSQLLVYYEDIGLPASYHSLERGQNIRTAARNLLGSPDSWKEIWATNPEIQSKGAAEQTVQLKYWDGSGTPPPPQPPQEVAQMPEETLPEEPPQQMPEPETVAAPIESPPPMEENFGDPLPEPSSQPSKVGIVETIQKNKLLAIGFIAFIALLLLIIKRIIHKIRDPGDEFDYTKTSIDENKISI